jgi:ribulose-phosphate 3-epimerase
MAQLSPSILSADFSRLGEHIRLIEASGADRIHVDVMDGRFVPGITIGPLVVSAIRPYSTLPMDVHLMVVEPERHLEAFAAAGADSLTVHAEGNPHLDRLLREIRALGKQAGVSLNPATHRQCLTHVSDLLDLVLLMTVNPGWGGQAYIPGMTGKIADLRQWLDLQGCAAPIHVDGGIGLSNVAEVTQAGAGVLITGSAFFGSADPKEFVRQMKALSQS